MIGSSDAQSNLRDMGLGLASRMLGGGALAVFLAVRRAEVRGAAAEDSQVVAMRTVSDIFLEESGLIHARLSCSHFRGFGSRICARGSHITR